MRHKPALLFAIAFFTGLLCACDKPAQSGQKAAVKQKADAKEDTSDTSQATEEKDDMSKADYQLDDDSLLTAGIKPWPPKNGSAKLKIEITPDDADEKFAGTLDYRIANKEENKLPWQPLKQLREDEDGNIHFQTAIKLPKGTSFIQFRVRDKGEEEYTELTDWKVDVN